MAKKKNKSKNNTDETEALAPQNKNPINWQIWILGTATLACMLAFLPTSILLGIGLLPTCAALMIDPTPDRIKTLSVAAMNMAGLTPFLLDLWTSGQAQSVGKAFEIIAQPANVITIYAAAAGGYIIFYTVSNLVSVLMLERGKARLKEVEEKLEDLERKWGREVTGAVQLDSNGFPIDEDDL